MTTKAEISKFSLAVNSEYKDGIKMNFQSDNIEILKMFNELGEKVVAKISEIKAIIDNTQNSDQY